MSSEIEKDSKYWQELASEQARFEKENHDPWTYPYGPFFQAVAKLRLDDLRENFEAGHKMSLLAAIRKCANHNLPLPEWASKAYILGYDKVLNCHSNSWDEVFGKPYPGKQIGRLKRRRDLMFLVYTRVREVLFSPEEYDWDQVCGIWKPTQKRTIDIGLFEEVGHEFGIEKTLCSELYYEAKKFFT